MEGDATGRLEVFVDGVPSGRFPYARAMFGTNTSCSLARLVRANPSSGCVAFSNADEVRCVGGAASPSLR
jgi:hypothetical protein